MDEYFLTKIFLIRSRYDGSNDLSTGEVYSPAVNVWSPITPMGTKRSCLGTAAYDGLIYCVGGYDGASCLRYTFRMFKTPRASNWSLWGFIPAKRIQKRVTHFSSVERYDPLTGVWTSCPAMLTRRRYCRAVIMGKSSSPLTGIFHKFTLLKDNFISKSMRRICLVA